VNVPVRARVRARTSGCVSCGPSLSSSARGVPFPGEAGPRPRRGTTERPRDVRPGPKGELEGNEK
jgi:hypothetical protein